MVVKVEDVEYKTRGLVVVCCLLLAFKIAPLPLLIVEFIIQKDKEILITRRKRELVITIDLKGEKR